MTLVKRGAGYIDRSSLSKGLSRNRPAPIRAIFALILAVTMGVFALLPMLTATLDNNTQNTSAPTISTAHAFFGDLGCVTPPGKGAAMDDKKGWEQLFQDYPRSDQNNRLWTMSEVLGGRAAFINYHGEPLVADQQSSNEYIEKVNGGMERLTADRNFWNCVGGNIMVSLSNTGMSFNSLVIGFTQFITTKAFDPNFICSDPDAENCFNLTGMIGGNGGSDEGLIGNLVTSVYMPLALIIVLVAAFSIFYLGMVKKQYRQALFSALWVAVSFIVGLTLLLNPSMLTKAPMALTNAVSSCIIGAFNGSSCLDGGTSNSTINASEGTSQAICSTQSSIADPNEAMQMTSAEISCALWRSFLLEPMSQGSFGTTFEELDVKKTGTVAQLAVEKAGVDPNIFCVGRKTSGTLDSYRNQTLVLTASNGSDTVCNLMTYQMFLQIDAQKAGAEEFNPANGEEGWYPLMAVTSQNEGMWGTWSGGMDAKFISTFVASFTTLAGGIVLLVLSAFALVYYVTTLILIAFAPIFAVIGIDPNRGRGMMLGWLEQVISNVLKYLIAAVFVVLTMAIYSGVLESAGGAIGLTLLFVIIMTLALLMYRGELTSMIGRVNMGGKQMSSRLTDSIANRAKGISRGSKKLGGAAVGGAVGAAIAGGSMSAGMKDGLKTTLKRGNGVVAKTLSQAERTSVDNQRDLKSIASDSANEAANLTKQAESKRAETQGAITDLNGLDSSVKNDLTDQQLLAGSHDEHEGLRHGVREEMVYDAEQERDVIVSAMENDDTKTADEKNAIIASAEAQVQATIDFGDLRAAMDQIQAGKIELEVAKAQGDVDGIAAATDKIKNAKAAAAAASATLSVEQRQALGADYDSRYASEMDVQGIEFGDEEYAKLHELTEYKLPEYAANRQQLVDHIDNLENEFDDISQQAVHKSAIAENANKKFLDYQPGQFVRAKDVNKFRDPESELRNYAENMLQQQREMGVPQDEWINVDDYVREHATPTDEELKRIRAFNESREFGDNKRFTPDNSAVVDVSAMGTYGHDGIIHSQPTNVNASTVSNNEDVSLPDIYAPNRDVDSDDSANNDDNGEDGFGDIDPNTGNGGPSGSGSGNSGNGSGGEGVNPQVIGEPRIGGNREGTYTERNTPASEVSDPLPDINESADRTANVSNAHENTSLPDFNLDAPVVSPAFATNASGAHRASGWESISTPIPNVHNDRNEAERSARDSVTGADFVPQQQSQAEMRSEAPSVSPVHPTVQNESERLTQPPVASQRVSEPVTAFTDRTMRDTETQPTRTGTQERVTPNTQRQSEPFTSSVNQPSVPTTGQFSQSASVPSVAPVSNDNANPVNAQNSSIGKNTERSAGAEALNVQRKNAAERMQREQAQSNEQRSNGEQKNDTGNTGGWNQRSQNTSSRTEPIVSTGSNREQESPKNANGWNSVQTPEDKPQKSSWSEAWGNTGGKDESETPKKAESPGVGSSFHNVSSKGTTPAAQSVLSRAREAAAKKDSENTGSTKRDQRPVNGNNVNNVRIPSEVSQKPEQKEPSSSNSTFKIRRDNSPEPVHNNGSTVAESVKREGTPQRVRENFSRSLPDVTEEAPVSQARKQTSSTPRVRADTNSVEESAPSAGQSLLNRMKQRNAGNRAGNNANSGESLPPKDGIRAQRPRRDVEGD